MTVEREREKEIPVFSDFLPHYSPVKTRSGDGVAGIDSSEVRCRRNKGTRETNLEAIIRQLHWSKEFSES